MAEEEAIDYTPLSSAKQTRILIWRDEVRLAALPPSPTDTTSDASSSVLSPSATNTTGGSSASSQHAGGPKPKTTSTSRRSRLWSRLSKHITKLSGSESTRAEQNMIAQELKSREEIRTGMYVEAAQGGPPALEGELGNERLARAQRLLKDGVEQEDRP